jgi:hypothetical protein
MLGPVLLLYTPFELLNVGPVLLLDTTSELPNVRPCTIVVYTYAQSFGLEPRRTLCEGRVAGLLNFQDLEG